MKKEVNAFNKLKKKLDYNPNFEGELWEMVGGDEPGTLLPIEDKGEIYPTNNQLSNHQLPDNYSYHTVQNEVSEKPLEHLSVKEIHHIIEEDVFPTLPPLWFDNKVIKIPTKVVRVLDQYIPQSYFDEIIEYIPEKWLAEDKKENRATAIELCLFALTNLNNTFFTAENTEDDYYKDGWKNLLLARLNEQFDNIPKLRIAIFSALMYVGKKGAIVECDKKWMKNAHGMGWRLGDNYFGKGIISYTLKTEYNKYLFFKKRTQLIKEAESNVITRNLLYVYPKTILPTVEQIKERAKQLIKEGFTTKKGKRLTFLNKHSRSRFSDIKTLSFVEDSIDIFEYLTEDALLIPSIGDHKSGGRVYDKFSLMPSWIREMVKIDGVSIDECDYSCLHPNLAIKLYGGKSKYLTHMQVAIENNIEISDVKKEHLSFFNKTWEQMSYSKLFNYYNNKETNMMENIFLTKKHNELKEEDKHKITSMDLFKEEVEIMTEVIGILNKEGIYVIYIFDALGCKESDKKRVLDVMNLIALKRGVYTTAK